MRRVLTTSLFIAPMSASRARTAPIGPGWLHEFKFDGVRAQAHIRAGRITIYSRSGVDFTHRFRLLQSKLQAIAVQSAIIDCELIARDARGNPSFQALLTSGHNSEELCLFAFDLLALNGEVLVRQPLEKRRAALGNLVRVTGEPALQFSQEFQDPIALFARASDTGFEGIVSKRRDAPYVSGRSRHWVKMKTGVWSTENSGRWQIFERP